MQALENMALMRFTDSEREELKKKLDLARKGKLSKKDFEELFKKLRITAAYWEKNKDLIQSNLRPGRNQL